MDSSRRSLETYEAVHTRTEISSQTLVGLYKVKYHSSNREKAIKKHKKGKLLPTNSDIELWTDGSFNKDNGGGAAALLIDYRNRDENDKPSEVVTGVKFGTEVTSSYGCEIIALNSGLT